MQTAATAGRGGAGRGGRRHHPGGLRPGTFHTFSGTGQDVVYVFDAAKDDYVQLDPGAAYNLIRAGADTVVDMEEGDEIILKNVTLSRLPAGWIFDG